MKLSPAKSIVCDHCGKWHDHGYLLELQTMPFLSLCRDCLADISRTLNEAIRDFNR